VRGDPDGRNPMRIFLAIGLLLISTGYSPIFRCARQRVVKKVRKERPQDYLKIVVAVIPKRMQIEDAGPVRKAADLTDASLWRF
jgi:hypothetical protein